MTDISLFIRLATDEALPKAEAIAWYRCVKDNLPSGVLASIQTTNSSGDPDVCFMVHKENNSGQHFYEIPLTRDLTEQETNEIKEVYKDSQGDIETSATDIESVRQGPADAVVIEENDYNQLCETLAKHQHQRWYEDRSKQGWSFGLEEDRKNQRHPMMRPWEQLPQKYQNIDYELPHLFMNFLAEQGYAVVSRKDLNKWLNKK